MKAQNSILLLICLLTGCATIDSQYYDAARAVSKDLTMIQTACFATITEIAKSGDNNTKITAINLLEKCKVETIKIEVPKRNILGL